MSALSLHDALPILFTARQREALLPLAIRREGGPDAALAPVRRWLAGTEGLDPLNRLLYVDARVSLADEDRKSTRLNSSHLGISYAVFCLKKKNGRRGSRNRGRFSKGGGARLRGGIRSPGDSLRPWISAARVPFSPQQFLSGLSWRMFIESHSHRSPSHRGGAAILARKLASVRSRFRHGLERRRLGLRAFFF